jgi:CheY-like chemotaxis protein
VKAGEDTRFFGGSETILVVEDEEPLRKIVESVLRRQGFKVLTAPSGLEALEVWAERGSEIDLLLTDMVMPNGITGGQLASRLRAEKPSLRVIYTSGYSADFYAPDRQEGAGTEFLAKPYVPTVLVNRVRDCLDRGKSREPARGGPRIPA